MANEIENNETETPEETSDTTTLAANVAGYAIVVGVIVAGVIGVKKLNRWRHRNDNVLDNPSPVIDTTSTEK
jgi:hypothetical protein